MRSSAGTVEEYLAELPEERRATLTSVRQVVLDHLPQGFEEVMQYGMISYVVPLERYPNTYNGQPLTVLSLANQKRHLALYLIGIYSDPDAQQWLRDRWATTGKKLDMGQSCLRFRSLDDLDLDIIGEAVARISPDDFVALDKRARS